MSSRRGFLSRCAGAVCGVVAAAYMPQAPAPAPYFINFVGTHKGEYVVFFMTEKHLVTHVEGFWREFPHPRLTHIVY